MPTSVISDPLRNFKFHVIIPRSNAPVIGFPRFGFMNVSGLAIQNEVTPYREGGDNTTTRKLPGQSDFGPITFSRGVAFGTLDEMFWFKQIFSVIQGAGSGFAGQNFRSDFVVNVLDHPVTAGAGSGAPGQPSLVRAKFRVYNAWPMSIAWSDLDAGGSGVLVQQVTLAHEGFDFDLANDWLAYLPE